MCTVKTQCDRDDTGFIGVSAICATGCEAPVQCGVCRIAAGLCAWVRLMPRMGEGCLVVHAAEGEALRR
jgi:hypothetical protein